MLILKAISQFGEPLEAPLSGRFGEEGGTIGRSPDCSMVLPDPGKHISRQQARIEWDGEGYVLSCLGSANALVVNGAEFATGQSVRLADGDSVLIAQYELKAEIGAAAAPVDDPLAGFGAASADPLGGFGITPAASKSSGDFGGGASGRDGEGSSDPFDDPLGGLPSGSDSRDADEYSADRIAGLARSSGDDPLGLGGERGRILEPGRNESESIDALFGLSGGDRDARARDPLSAPSSGPNTAASSDPFASLSSSRRAPDEPNPIADRGSELSGSFKPPEVIPATSFGVDPAKPTRSSGPPRGDASTDAAAARDAEPESQSSRRAAPQAPAALIPDDPLALDVPGSPTPPTPIPAEPIPSDPIPAEPIPTETIPSDPIPSDPIPSDPTPSTPIPADPIHDPIRSDAIASDRGSAKPADPQRSERGATGAAGAIPATRRLEPDEIQSIAERVADEHRSDFEAPAQTRPTDLIASMNKAQRDAIRAHAGAASATRDSRADGAAAANAALLKALLSGLALEELPGSPLGGKHAEQALTPELMKRIGELLRVATQGTIDLLQARATIKREMKAEVTMIVSSDNNPLKFSPDSQSAIAHLLAAQSVRGFMLPVESMRDAHDDLLAHQVAFIAGMRAAMQGLIARFDPAALESRLTRKSMIDSMLPMARRARLWELFNELFGDISREAEDDFETLFGREFVRAYEEQIARLDKGGK